MTQPEIWPDLRAVLNSQPNLYDTDTSYTLQPVEALLSNCGNPTSRFLALRLPYENGRGRSVFVLSILN